MIFNIVNDLYKGITDNVVNYTLRTKVRVLKRQKNVKIFVWCAEFIFIFNSQYGEIDKKKCVSDAKI